MACKELDTPQGTINAAGGAVIEKAVSEALLKDSQSSVPSMTADFKFKDKGTVDVSVNGSAAQEYKVEATTCKKGLVNKDVSAQGSVVGPAEKHNLTPLNTTYLSALTPGVTARIEVSDKSGKPLRSLDTSCKLDILSLDAKCTSSIKSADGKVTPINMTLKGNSFEITLPSGKVLKGSMDYDEKTKSAKFELAQKSN